MLRAESVVASATPENLTCPWCGATHSTSLPVNLAELACHSCDKRIEPIQWHDGRPVHLGRMQRLLYLCYTHPSFARKILEVCQRDPLRGRNEEWGLDKSLLATHAAHALAIRGHRQPWLFFLLPLGASIPLGIAPLPPLGAAVVLLLAASGIARARAFADRFLRLQHYDPSKLDPSRIDLTDEMLESMDGSELENLYFAGEHNPFDALGTGHESWSILVDRRKRDDGSLADAPIEFDLDTIRTRIVDRIVHGSGPESASGTFSVSEVTFVDSRRTKPDQLAFFEPNRYARSSVACPEQLQAIEKDDTCRTYSRVVFYDASRDIRLTTLLRLIDHGPFTNLEVVGCHLLPLADRLFDHYSLKPDASEIRDTYLRPRWWFRRSAATRSRIGFVVGSLIVLLGFWLFSAPTVAQTLGDGELVYALVQANLLPLIFLLLLVAWTYGRVPRIDDLYKPRPEVPFPLSLIVPNSERQREKRLRDIRIEQDAGMFDYRPPRESLRVGQSRWLPSSYFEDTHLRLLRQSHTLAIQDAFLRALEDAGIDTSDFREGASRINNYGVINSGKISGNVMTEATAEPPKARSRVAPKERQGTRT